MVVLLWQGMTKRYGCDASFATLLFSRITNKVSADDDNVEHVTIYPDGIASIAIDAVVLHEPGADSIPIEYPHGSTGVAVYGVIDELACTPLYYDTVLGPARYKVISHYNCRIKGRSDPNTARQQICIIYNILMDIIILDQDINQWC
jgi:hypothetical protein